MDGPKRGIVFGKKQNSDIFLITVKEMLTLLPRNRFRNRQESKTPSG
jgi:hypothetical protein